LHLHSIAVTGCFAAQLRSEKPNKSAMQVLESWRLVLRGDFQIRLENVRVHATQTSGYVTCVEVMNAGNATGRYE